MLESFPALDIRDLIARGYIAAGSLTAWSFRGVTQEGTPLGGFGASDCRDLGAAHLVLRLSIGRQSEPEKTFDQVLDLSPGDSAGRQRWRFTNSEHEVLYDCVYWRGGRFADATSQNLVHRSQMRPWRNKPGHSAAPAARDSSP